MDDRKLPCGFASPGIPAYGCRVTAAPLPGPTLYRTLSNDTSACAPTLYKQIQHNTSHQPSDMAVGAVLSKPIQTKFCDVIV